MQFLGAVSIFFCHAFTPYKTSALPVFMGRRCFFVGVDLIILYLRFKPELESHGSGLDNFWTHLGNFWKLLKFKSPV